MKKFEQYFKLPIILDLWGNYVWDDNNTMVWQFCEDQTGWSDVDKQQEIVDWINGVQGVKPTLKTLTYDSDRAIINEDGYELICMRGWGYLTGTGGLSLSDKEAIEVQDSLAEYIIEKLR